MSSRTKEREEEDDDRKSVLDRYKLEPRQRKDHRKTFGTTRDANERVSGGVSESREKGRMHYVEKATSAL